MAKTYKIEGVTFQETGDPLQDAYAYNWSLNQYRTSLQYQTPGTPAYEKTTKIIAGIVKRKGELDKVVKTNTDKAKNDKAIKKAQDNVKKYDAQARAAADSQNVEAYQTAVANANAERQIILDAGGTPPPPPTITPPSGSKDKIVTPTATGTTDSGTPVDLGTDKFSEYTYNNDGTVTNLNGDAGVFVNEVGADGNITPKFYTSKAQARDAFLKQYAEPGQLNALKNQLLSSGYIKQSQLNDGSWVTGIDDMLVKYTVKAVSDVKYNSVSEPMSMSAFLSLKKVSTGGSGDSGRYQIITTRGDAKKILDNYLTDLVGRKATEEEEEAFYTELHSTENKKVQTSKNGTVTGSVMTEAERLLIAAKVARKSLKDTDVESLLKSGTGSQAAMDIAALQKTASSYGVPMTAAEALKYVAAGLGQDDYLGKQSERIKLVGKQLHPTLAAHIDAGGTVKDIADVYAYTKATKLGIPVADSTYDADVMDAVKNGISTTDFARNLQKKSEWRFTEEAHSAANSFANKILSSFGFGG